MSKVSKSATRAAKNPFDTKQIQSSLAKTRQKLHVIKESMTTGIQCVEIKTSHVASLEKQLVTTGGIIKWLEENIKLANKARNEVSVADSNLRWQTCLFYETTVSQLSKIALQQIRDANVYQNNLNSLNKQIAAVEKNYESIIEKIKNKTDPQLQQQHQQEPLEKNISATQSGDTSVQTVQTAATFSHSAPRKQLSSSATVFSCLKPKKRSD